MNTTEQGATLTEMQQATLDYCRDMIAQLAAMCEAQDLDEQARALTALHLD